MAGRTERVGDPFHEKDGNGARGLAGQSGEKVPDMPQEMQDIQKETREIQRLAGKLRRAQTAREAYLISKRLADISRDLEKSAHAAESLERTAQAAG
jgi:hypothetical protein